MVTILNKFLSFVFFLDGNLVTSVIPTCSNSSATVTVVPRSYSDIQSEDSYHEDINFRIDYICIGNDSQKVSENMAKQIA